MRRARLLLLALTGSAMTGMPALAASAHARPATSCAIPAGALPATGIALPDRADVLDLLGPAAPFIPGIGIGIGIGASLVASGTGRRPQSGMTAPTGGITG